MRILAILAPRGRFSNYAGNATAVPSFCVDLQHRLENFNLTVG